ncbi:Iron siderophore sensor protein [Comamonas aquatilis]|uniref:FecR family protein n=1 Tax=Comamonas aquatilis TaxID=1778406 RepID=UPI0039EFBF43
MNPLSQPKLLPDAADDIRLQAAAWLVRRADEDWLLEDEQALQRWLDADVANRQAYAHAQHVWAELGALGQSGLLPDRGTDTVLETQPLLQGRMRRRMLWKGAGAAVFAAGALWVGAGSQIMLAFEADYRTGVGERREIALPDGSRVHLGGGSAVAVRYDAQQRQVILLRGEALFDAKPVDVPSSRDAEKRPFVVAAADGRTRALGTRFIVERFDERTQVTGVFHQVAVSLDHAPQDAVVVSPGQRVSYDRQGVSSVQDLSEDVGQSWERGLLVFERMTLADVVGRLNRYHTSRIVVRGQALAQRRVSGVFLQSDVPGAVQGVAQELGARLLQLPGLVVLF